MDCKIIVKSDYAGKLLDKKLHVLICYYTNRQMKSIYPNRNFRILGEVGNKTGVQCGVADNLDMQPLPIYKENTHNGFTERIVGYTSVDAHTYLSVVKNVLWRRILIFVLVAAIFVLGVMNYKNLIG